MKHFLIFLTGFFTLFSCTKNEDLDFIAGDWKYVRSFKIYQSYFCYECPDFNYDSTRYLFTLDKNLNMTGKINLLDIGGQAQAGIQEKTKDAIHGNFEFTNFTLYNKPIEFPEDTEFKNKFEKVSRFQFVLFAHSEKYDFLEFTSDDETLLFARKK